MLSAQMTPPHKEVVDGPNDGCKQSKPTFYKYIMATNSHRDYTQYCIICITLYKQHHNKTCLMYLVNANQ